ncbi:Uncharacterised protein [Mycobacterium tuberculosis]|uniref:Uncharacterized protein n=1 Tax=Mycobacterium tuberculosis TaxID=1773 RepID=A0A916LCH0_MYCTX|nr:Uncharacterised protein [Mycobacterium tuberculosis]CKV04065.1 Uncharacterised protein [Mycobacterium tuberculosis]COY74273.1 Uncharacterised protein [Mycobacterium tuberculosis]SGO29339.1 Uncharacterised protein [Mycobacterium tuberculosis]
MVYVSNGQAPGLPCASIVVATCAGSFPTGYCRSPSSFSGYNRTEVSVVNTWRRWSIIESSGSTSTFTSRRFATVCSSSKRIKTTVSSVVPTSGCGSGPGVWANQS